MPPAHPWIEWKLRGPSLPPPPTPRHRRTRTLPAAKWRSGVQRPPMGSRPGDGCATTCRTPCLQGLAVRTLQKLKQLSEVSSVVPCGIVVLKLSPRSPSLVPDWLHGPPAWHEAGNVHLDIKPVTGSLDTSGGVVVLDAGHARKARLALSWLRILAHYRSCNHSHTQPHSHTATQPHSHTHTHTQHSTSAGWFCCP